ncbi:hypothetical protein RND71_036052 [Anisodus tanguticus]|uniref:Bet v I/Major latex protein domain-containing protein n=1 Tax=Anisodus tanguticus TaxID=243964 RepID=A0AAE1R6N8_9SOLA|nr:hypothetical protein RND71_036052 [Anisodus tanguticus]
MTITSFTDEYTSPVPPSRIFRASIVDSHNLMPKLMPQAIKSIEFVQGNGGAGTIKQINFPEVFSDCGFFSACGNFKSIKYRIDEINEEKFVYKYTLIEGDALVDKLEKIIYEVKFEQSPDGGSISKVTSTYYKEGDFKLKEEEIKAGKEKVSGMYKAVEAYLIQNPDAYA